MGALAVAFSIAASAGVASFKNSIPLLPGEVWWGGGGGDGQNQPYGLKDSRRDDLGEEHVGPKTLRFKDVPLDRLPRYEHIDGKR